MDATLAETVMVDEGGVKITATCLTYTGYSVDLELTIENNSGKNLSFVSGSLGYSCNSVNGYMVNDGYLNCDVANGKKVNDTISFSCDALILYGIDEIANMEIGFSDELFGPNDAISREQMATSLYHYAQYKGYDTMSKADLSKYTDATQVGSYAVDAIRWANQRRGPGQRHQRHHAVPQGRRHTGAGGCDSDPVLPEHRKITRVGIAPHKQ